MNEAHDYFPRCIPDPYRILGLQLLPLSLGRYRLLKRFDCAFVADGPAKADISDLLLGLVICSLRVEEFILMANAGQLAKEVCRWSRKACPHSWVGLIPWLGKWWRKKHSFNYAEKILLFQEYITEAQKIPAYRELESNSQSSGAHWSHGVEVTLRSEVGWSREEIDEQPLSKAIGDYFKHCENKGLIQLMTPEEVAAPELTANMDAAILAKLERLPELHKI